MGILKTQVKQRRFKLGDLVVCAYPEECGLPRDRIATVVDLIEWKELGRDDQPFAVRVDYGYPSVEKDLARYEWVFKHWSPTESTDAGATEYEEIMAIQEQINGHQTQEG